MKRLFVPANDNIAYEHKEEFLRLHAIVMPKVKSYRWDREHRVHHNLLWFLRFEVGFSNDQALVNRKNFKIV